MIMGDPVLKRDNFDELKGGYPDMGDGLYSQKLSYADWFTFKKAQRGHLNMLESVTIVCFLILVSGLSMPFTSVVLGSIYGVFRPLYFMENRAFGFIPGFLASWGLVGTSLYTVHEF